MHLKPYNVSIGLGHQDVLLCLIVTHISVLKDLQIISENMLGT